MPCDWEGNRRFGVALVMRPVHTLIVVNGITAVELGFKNLGF